MKRKYKIIWLLLFVLAAFALAAAVFYSIFLTRGTNDTEQHSPSSDVQETMEYINGLEYQHVRIIEALCWSEDEDGGRLTILTDSQEGLRCRADEYIYTMENDLLPVSELQVGDMIRVSNSDPGVLASMPAQFPGPYYITYIDDSKIGDLPPDILAAMLEGASSESQKRLS